MKENLLQFYQSLLIKSKTVASLPSLPFTHHPPDSPSQILPSYGLAPPMRFNLPPPFLSLTPPALNLEFKTFENNLFSYLLKENHSVLDFVVGVNKSYFCSLTAKCAR